jgi:hypothetical protein
LYGRESVKRAVGEKENESRLLALFGIREKREKISYILKRVMLLFLK